MDLSLEACCCHSKKARPRCCRSFFFSFTIRVILHEVMGEGPNAFHDWRRCRAGSKPTQRGPITTWWPQPEIDWCCWSAVVPSSSLTEHGQWLVRPQLQSTPWGRKDVGLFSVSIEWNGAKGSWLLPVSFCQLTWPLPVSRKNQIMNGINLVVIYVA